MPQLHKLEEQDKLPKLIKESAHAKHLCFQCQGTFGNYTQDCPQKFSIYSFCLPFVFSICLLCVRYFKGLKVSLQIFKFYMTLQRHRLVCLVIVVKVLLSNQVSRPRDNINLSHSHLGSGFYKHSPLDFLLFSKINFSTRIVYEIRVQLSQTLSGKWYSVLSLQKTTLNYFLKNCLFFRFRKVLTFTCNS